MYYRGLKWILKDEQRLVKTDVGREAIMGGGPIGRTQGRRCPGGVGAAATIREEDVPEGLVWQPQSSNLMHPECSRMVQRQ